MPTKTTSLTTSPTSLLSPIPSSLAVPGLFLSLLIFIFKFEFIHFSDFLVFVFVGNGFNWIHPWFKLCYDVLRSLRIIYAKIALLGKHWILNWNFGVAFFGLILWLLLLKIIIYWGKKSPTFFITSTADGIMWTCAGPVRKGGVGWGRDPLLKKKWKI